MSNQQPSTSASSAHPVVSREEWLAARRELLAREKAHTRAADALYAQRRTLPWVRVEKEYVFTTAEGPRTLAELFEHRSQLIIYHFMLAPGWAEGCDGCSFISDHIDGANLHLRHHDVTLLAVSRATLPEIEAFKKRMGWQFKWVSSHNTDFNYDFHVAFTPEQIAAGQAMYNYEPYTGEMEDLHGLSVFTKDEHGTVYHTYSTFARGGDILIGAHNFLDLTPKGRNETSTMDWVRLHDMYEEEAAGAGVKEESCCGG